MTLCIRFFWSIVCLSPLPQHNFYCKSWKYDKSVENLKNKFKIGHFLSLCSLKLKFFVLAGEGWQKDLTSAEVKQKGRECVILEWHECGSSDRDLEQVFTAMKSRIMGQSKLQFKSYLHFVL